ncbi:hypothetical protein [Amycolatopsis sp. H20-H5]|nr:hypothetical protein [Amycolatopsis sp. H20-H5]MEC3973990.1 hypothetical protein [Amycolatopsis sp. H20-H5]
MPDPARFWRDGPGASPSEESVRDAERLLDVKLPASLLELLRIRRR